jgi:hypothetical protein
LMEQKFTLDIFVIIKHIKSLNHFCQVKNYSLAFLCSILMISIQCTQYNKQKKMDPSTKLRNLDIARASSQIIVIMLPALVESQ